MMKEHTTWNRADGVLKLERDEDGMVYIAVNDQRLAFKRGDALVVAYWLDSAVRRHDLISEAVEAGR